MPRLDDLLIGFGSGALEQYTTRKAEERKMAMELANAKALLEEKERLASLYDPERILANRILNLAGAAKSRAQQGLRLTVSPQATPEQRERLQALYQQRAQEAGQEAELNILRHIMPRQAMGTNVYFADTSSQTLSPGTQLPPGSRVIPTRASPEETEDIARARVRGQLEERGLAGESAGRLSAASQGSRLSSKAKSILFPNGPRSFRRDLALKLQDPTGAALVGDKEAQELEFAIGRAIDSQRLVQTGVNFRSDELKRLVRQFIANALADPDAAYLRVQELNTSLEETRRTIDPQNRFSGTAMLEESSNVNDPNDPLGLF